MSSLSEDLADLHRLLLELEEVEEMLSSGPRKVAAQQRVADKKQAQCEQQQAHITSLRKASDEKSLQLKTNEARIAEHQAKLNIASSNREYEIIKTQIEANTMANSVLEDEILESLDKVDTAVQELAELKGEHEAAVEKQKKTAAEVAESSDGLKANADDLNGRITEAEKKVPASAKEAYLRLRGAHGASALSAVENNACVACYSEFSPQHRVALNLGKVLFCHSCARLVYRAG